MIVNVQHDWRIPRRLVCLVVRHDWSDWRPQELDEPGTMVRVCARCGRVQSNETDTAQALNDLWWRGPIQ
jgi:hypothetical protein